MSAVTPFHLATLVRGETKLEVWSLATGALVGSLDLSKVLMGPPRGVTGKKEIVSRMVLIGDGRCAEHGLLLATSFSAVV